MNTLEVGNEAFTPCTRGLDTAATSENVLGSTTEPVGSAQFRPNFVATSKYVHTRTYRPSDARGIWDIEGQEAHHSKVTSLIGIQQCIVLPVGREFLEDDGSGLGILHKGPFIVVILHELVS